MTAEQQKREAARYAADLVADGMRVGLGTGTTARFLVEGLVERVRAGLHFTGVPTSDEIAALAMGEGLSLATLDDCPHLDMTIDGADEVDPQLNLIKGRGGALTREKLVALAAARYVIIVDESKLVDRLGDHHPVPVEVVPFGWVTTRGRLETLGLDCTLRGGDKPFVTDNGNYILDCRPCAGCDLADPATANAIKLQTGVLEDGLFLGMAPLVVIGMAHGVETRSAETSF